MTKKHLDSLDVAKPEKKAEAWILSKSEEESATIGNGRKSITLWLDFNLYTRLKKHCQKKGISMTQFIAKAVDEAL